MIPIFVPIISSLIVISGELTINYPEYQESIEKAVCESWSDCKAMTEAIVFESRGEPVEGQKAVSDVILCRYMDSRWPDTVTGVIHQKNQFSYIKDMHRQKMPSERDFKKARHIALTKLLNLDEPVVDACWYHATHVKPSWAKEMKLVATIGNHKFYKDW